MRIQEWRQGTGTGFFFKILNDEAAGRYVPVVITNKHVIKNSTRGKLIITKADEDHNPLDTEHFQAYIENFESCWRNHPDNDVDLCAMPIAELRRAADKMGEKLFYIPLDKSVLPSQQQLTEFSALEEILMIGYPDDIWDKVNNKPIFRRGITAIQLVIRDKSREFIYELSDALGGIYLALLLTIVDK